MINGLLMGVAGLFGNGAANLISAACTADLGKQQALHANAAALATVIGYFPAYFVVICMLRKVENYKNIFSILKTVVQM